MHIVKIINECNDKFLCKILKHWLYANCNRKDQINYEFTKFQVEK